MSRYLTKAQVRELLFMLDGERYDDIDNYRELKRILFNELPNYYGKRKFRSIRAYINREIMPQRIQNIADDLDIFNSYTPPQQLTRLTPSALTIKDRIIQQINSGKDFDADFSSFDDLTQETYLLALTESLKNLKLKNRNKYLTLTLDYGGDNICMRVINSKTLEHIKRLIEIIEGKINDDIEDFADSDQALLFAFMKLQGFSLEWYDYEKPHKDGGYFPYFNLNQDLDLSLFGIYHNDEEANYSDNCFTLAAINSKLFTNDEIQYIRSLINTRYLPRDDLKEIANIMNIEIDIYYYNEKRKKIDKAVRFNKNETLRNLRLLLRCGHYMLYHDELVPNNKYDVKNLNTLLSKMFENHEFRYIQDFSKAEKFIVSEFEFDKLEYPSYCVRQFNINTKHKQNHNHNHNELATVLSSTFNNNTFHFVKLHPIKTENLFDSMNDKTLIYVPDLKGVVFPNADIQVKPLIYRNTVQQITLRRNDKVVYIRNFKSLTSIDASNKDINSFDELRCKIEKTLKDKFNVDINQFSTLPIMTFNIAHQMGVFDDVYELSGIVKSFAQKCIRGGLVRTLYDGCFEVDDVTCFDLNSSYGTSMTQMNGIPKGKPKPFYKHIPDNACYYWVQVNIKNISSDKLGRYGFVNEGINFVDSITLNEIKKYVKCDIEIINGYYFDEGFNDNLKHVVHSIFDLRKVDELNKMGKNMLSSLYGKSLQNAQQFKIKMVHKNEMNKFIGQNGNYIYTITKNKNDMYTVKLLKSLNLNFNIPQFGVSVLSESRKRLNDVIYKCSTLNIPIYAIKTDSIVVDNDKVDILPITIGNELGQFKIEYIAKNIKFTSPKCYKAILNDDSIRTRGKVN